MQRITTVRLCNMHLISDFPHIIVSMGNIILVFVNINP